MTCSAALSSAWEKQSIWSLTADRLKARLTIARTSMLALSVLAAILETLASQLVAPSSAPTLGRNLGLVGVAAIAAAGFLKARWLNRDQVRDWTQARSVSEAIKKHVYLYLTDSGEYGGSGSDARLARSVSALLERARHLEPFAAGVEPETREPPRRMGARDYIETRLKRQIDGYYRPRAKRLAARLARFRKLELVLMGAAAVLGGTAFFGAAGRSAAWVAVITTVSGALLAHAEASRYEQSLISYRVTANRLEALRDEWTDSTAEREPTRQEVAELVESCEAAISVENQGWMAEWSPTRSDRA